MIHSSMIYSPVIHCAMSIVMRPYWGVRIVMRNVIRTRTIEVVTIRIAAVDVETPTVVSPSHRTIEIVGGHVAVELPASEHVAQTVVTERPITAKDIVTRQPHQVVEIDFIHCLVLLVGQVELVGHLICQEQGFGSCLVV